MFRLSFILYVFIQVLSVKSFSESDLDETDLICLEKLGFDKSLVINSYDENEFIIEGNHEMEKFYACAWELDNLLKDGSVILKNLQNMVEIKLKKLISNDGELREQLAKKAVEKCKDVKGKNDGDTCIKMYNCMSKLILADLS